MKEMRMKKIGVALCVVALAAFALVLSPKEGSALPVCAKTADQLCGITPYTHAATWGTDDCDEDGLTDQQECVGINLAGSARGFNGYNGTLDSSSTEKMDPSKADLFFFVTNMQGVSIKNTNSALDIALNHDPANALTVYSSGLAVRTHLIEVADVSGDRLVTATQKAVWIRENPSLTEEGTYLGSTPESRPTSLNVSSKVYSNKIVADVNKNCPPGKACSVKGTNPLITNSNGANNLPIINHYIKQVVSHEVGHGSMLAPTTAASYYHYSKSGTVMDPNATFSRGVYTIPAGFDPTKDKPAVKLK